MHDKWLEAARLRYKLVGMTIAMSISATVAVVLILAGIDPTVAVTVAFALGLGTTYVVNQTITERTGPPTQPILIQVPTTGAPQVANALASGGPAMVPGPQMPVQDQHGEGLAA